MGLLGWHWGAGVDGWVGRGVKGMPRHWGPVLPSPPLPLPHPPIAPPLPSPPPPSQPKMIERQQQGEGGESQKEIPIPGVQRVPTYPTDYLPTFRDRNTYLRGKGGWGGGGGLGQGAGPVAGAGSVAYLCGTGVGEKGEPSGDRGVERVFLCGWVGWVGWRAQGALPRTVGGAKGACGWAAAWWTACRPLPARQGR